MGRRPRRRLPITLQRRMTNNDNQEGEGDQDEDRERHQEEDDVEDEDEEPVLFPDASDAPVKKVGYS